MPSFFASPERMSIYIKIDVKTTAFLDTSLDIKKYHGWLNITLPPLFGSL